MPVLMFSPYREIEHTADLRLEIRALSWPGLLENAVSGLMDSMIDLATVGNHEQRTLKLEAAQRDDLLVRCLKKVHLLLEIESFLTRRLKVLRADEYSLEAIAFGEKLDPKRHRLKTEIKAITYHQLEVTRTWWGWRARVLFDI